MAPKTDPAEKSFNAALRKRLRDLRERRGLTQSQMATALGIETDRYRKYETRSMIPAFYLLRAAIICGASVEYLVTGQDAGRKRPLPLSVVGLGEPGGAK